MTRRYEGYVVGKQTVQQQKGWKIGRRTRAGKTNYFAPEAEIADVFEIFTGAEVTFSIETRDGRSYALNVQPKTVNKMEDSMRKLTMGVIAALILAIVAVLAIFKPHHNEPFRGWIVEIRADWALKSIRKLTADQIVTDEVIRKAMNGVETWGPSSLRSISWAGREAVFWDHQCPIFTMGYDDVYKTCDTARYSEGRTEHNSWYERAGIPVSIAPIIAQMRTELYQIGRNYLMIPANLEAAYAAKSDVVFATYLRMSSENQEMFMKVLSSAIASFEQFRDDNAARVKYAHYMRTEQSWSSDWDSGEKYDAHEIASRDLSESVQGDMYLFAGRRHSEGGDELVQAWIDVLTQMRTNLQTGG